MFLGIDNDGGQIYEGGGAPQFPVFPRPAISLVKVIETPDDWNNLPRDISHTPFPWCFREDSFDPVTRVRRGRLYESYQNAQPQSWPVAAHPFDNEGAREVAASRQLVKRLFTYFPCQTMTARPDRGHGLLLAIGSGRAASAWRVIQVETLIDQDILVTLKAISAFGIIPEINSSKIEPANQQSVRQAIDRVLDSAFRETAISVIDHCRNAAQVVISRWMLQEGADTKVLAKDLDQVCKAVEAKPYSKFATRDAANIIRILHTRGKANKLESEGLRSSVEEDAELSIQALGFILREVGWAN